MPSKENKPIPQDNGIDASSKIEAIKNLIFGENIQEYNTEFEALKKDIELKKKELEILIDDVKSHLENTLDSVATDINIRITELEKSFEERALELDEKNVEKEVLGNLLINLGEKIKTK